MATFPPQRDGHVVLEIHTLDSKVYRWEFDSKEATATRELPANTLQFNFGGLSNEIVTKGEAD